MKWEKQSTFLVLCGRACEITLEARPHYCDRGNWVAKVHRRKGTSMMDWIALGLDDQDGWPRYYFDLERAKLEIEAWLTKRGQAVA